MQELLYWCSRILNPEVVYARALVLMFENFKPRGCLCKSSCIDFREPWRWFWEKFVTWVGSFFQLHYLIINMFSEQSNRNPNWWILSKLTQIQGYRLYQTVEGFCRWSSFRWSQKGTVHIQDKAKFCDFYLVFVRYFGDNIRALTWMMRGNGAGRVYYL